MPRLEGAGRLLPCLPYSTYKPSDFALRHASYQPKSNPNPESKIQKLQIVKCSSAFVICSLRFNALSVTSGNKYLAIVSRLLAYSLPLAVVN